MDNIQSHIKRRIFNILKDQIIENFEESEIHLEYPDSSEFGDISTNLALIAFKKIKTSISGVKTNNIPSKFSNTKEFANYICANLTGDEIIKKVEVAGPGFLNIWLQTDCVIKDLYRVLKEGKEYGKGKIDEEKRIVVDYSAPNIAKPFGIGHLRSTIIGQALYNLLRFQGYKVIGDNHLGDWGTQFGKLLYMIDEKKDSNLTIEKLEQWYVEFHSRLEKEPELEQAGREWFKRLESGDEQAKKLWKICVDISMSEYKPIYSLLNVTIDHAYGESFYEQIMPEVISDAKRLGLAYESEGALVIDVPGSHTPLMLVKSDGASTYATRDLATIKFRMQEWKPVKIIYEVGHEQTLHFQQIFSVASALGYTTASTELVHTKHGLYLAPDGKKFSTRSGKTVKLEAVLEEAIDRATRLGVDDRETATSVGVGAVKYFDLSHNISSDIVFDWESIMALQGNSGPYLQYAYARTQSILEKYEKKSFDIDMFKDYRINLAEEMVVKTVIKFGSVVEQSASRLQPNLLCNYLFELAQSYNAFYNNFSVLQADEAIQRDFRILMTTAVGQVLKNGLHILGIEAVKRM